MQPMTSGNYNLLVILGATASGKTRLGVDAARALNGEIVSADSRQVYRGMDLGTGKDLEEYSEIPCHLIDVADPGEDFSVFHFQRQFLPSTKPFVSAANCRSWSAAPVSTLMP